MGWLDKYSQDIPKAQAGETIRKWNLDYINSPKYKERLESSGYENIDKEIKIRNKNVKNTKIKYIDDKQSHYDFPTKTVNIRDMDDEFLTSTGSNVLSHELGHAEIDSKNKMTGRLNKEDYSQLYGRANRSGAKKHDLDPRESKADINALRYELMQQGIYDAGKQDFTKEHLNKSKNSFIKERLLKNFSEEDLIYIMNNVANNSSKTNIPIAQNGITQLKEVEVKGLSNAAKMKAYRDSLTAFNNAENYYNKSNQEYRLNTLKRLEGYKKGYLDPNEAPEWANEQPERWEKMQKERIKEIDDIITYYNDPSSVYTYQEVIDRNKNNKGNKVPKLEEFEIFGTERDQWGYIKKGIQSDDYLPMLDWRTIEALKKGTVLPEKIISTNSDGNPLGIYRKPLKPKLTTIQGSSAFV